MALTRLIGPSNPAPYSVHLLVTAHCSRGCSGCFYRSLEPGEWTLEQAQALCLQAGEMGVRWLALGGGEPTEWEPLEETIRVARGHGLHVAVTTANLDWQPEPTGLPSRVHISCDPMHGIGPGAAGEMARFLRAQGVAEVGLNVIAGEPGFVERVLEEVRGLDVVLLLPKPVQIDRAWLRAVAGILAASGSTQAPGRILVDGCLGRLLALDRGRAGRCLQGRTSMALDQLGRASVCSNVPVKVEAGSLAAAWQRIRLHSDGPAPGCLVQGPEDGTRRRTA